MLNAYDRTAGRPVTGGWIALVRSGQSARGLAHAQTLRVSGACGARASVLECGGPPPLWPAPNCKRTPQKLWQPFIFHSSFSIFHLKIGGFKVIQGCSRLNFFSPCQGHVRDQPTVFAPLSAERRSECEVGMLPNPSPAQTPFHASRITHHASRITHHASRITHHASRITHHASRITHHASRITHHASRITHHARWRGFNAVLMPGSPVLIRQNRPSPAK